MSTRSSVSISRDGSRLAPSFFDDDTPTSPAGAAALPAPPPVAGVWVPEGARPHSSWGPVVAAHEAEMGLPARWTPSRFILINYWCFGYQEFHFVDGHLVLHGSNGSGKTTVLTAAMPVALFGTKNATALDAASGKSRSLEFNVLGSGNNLDNLIVDTGRTSYLLWEFRKPGTADVITIGQIVHGDRAGNQPKLKPVGVVLRDGRRIGIDLALWAKGSGDTLMDVFDIDEAIAALTSLDPDPERATIFTHKVSDYRAAIARHLFGTERVEDLDHLERTLLAIRSPMLNSALRPSAICGMLSASLPEIDTQMLATLDTSLKDLERIRDDQRKRERELETVEILAEAHAALVRARARHLANGFRFHRQRVDAGETKIRDAEARIARLATERTALAAAEAEAQATLDGLAHTRATLQAHEGMQLSQSLVQQQESLRDADRRLARARGDLTRRQQAIASSTTQEHAARERFGEAVQQVTELLGQLESLADDASWAVGRGVITPLVERLRTVAPDALPIVDETDAPPAHLAAVDARIEQVQRMRVALKRFNEATDERMRAVARREPALQDYQRAETRWNDSRTRLESQRTAAVAEVRAWLTRWHSRLVDLPRDAGAAAEAFLRQYQDPGTKARDAIAPLSTTVALATTTALRERDAAADLLNSRKRQQRDAERALANVRAEPEHLPVAKPGQTAARDAFRAAGIDARPLYTVLAPRDDAAPALTARAEAALREAGLLTALVVAPSDRARAAAALAALALSDGGDTWLTIDAPIADAPDDAGSESAGAGSLATLFEPVDAGPHAAVVTAFLAHTPAVTRASGPRSTTDALAVDATTGAWRHGLVAGLTATALAAPEFIGVANRRAARARRIQALETEVAELTRLVDQATQALEQTIAVLDELEEARAELAGMSVLDDLKTTVGTVRDRDQDMARAHAAVQRVSEEIQRLSSAEEEARAAWLAARAPVRALAEATLQGLDRALGAMHRWRELAAQWPRRWAAVHRDAAGVTDAVEQLALALEERGNAEEGLREAEHDVASQSESVYRLEQLVAASGAADVKRQLLQLADDETAAREAEKKAGEGRAAVDAQIGEARREIADVDAALAEPRETAVLAESDFVQYVMQHGRAADALAAMRQALESKGALAAALQGTPKDAGPVTESSRRDTEGRTTTADKTWVERFGELHTELDAFALERLDHLDTVRFQIAEVTHDSLSVLKTHLEDQVAKQKQLYQEHEEDLYKRVFLDELADELRRKIKLAQGMVQELRDALRRRTLQDGERLGLTWHLGGERKPGRGGMLASDLWTSAESAAARRSFVEHLTASGELHTRRDDVIHEIHRYLKDHLQVLRARADAGQLARIDGIDVANFREALATAFDYRRWYDFQILSIPKGEATGKPISDETFTHRSGGQRVAATLVPLLAAIEVRCRAFGDDSPAPRLIALDEAFAGVDTENTDALFALLDEFEMSWIMSSEKLVGVASTLGGAMTQVFHKKTRAAKRSVVACEYLVWDGLAKHDTGAHRSESAAGGT